MFGRIRSITLTRYFVISDYLVFPQYEEDGHKYDIQVLPQRKGAEARVRYLRDNDIPISVLRNRTLVSISKNTELKVVYFSHGSGNILIKATGLRSAYQLARAFQTYLTVYCEVPPDDDRTDDYLIELSQMPHHWWDEEQLANSIVSKQSLDPGSIVLPLTTGRYLFAGYLTDVPKYVPIIYGDVHISEATAHLDQSYALFYGLMSGSYYHFHYARDRVEQSRDIRLKNYLEHRPRYELAFLAAFKAIELLIGNGNLKNATIDSAFRSNPYTLIKPSEVWERFHEIFVQKPRFSSFRVLLKQFLDMRNVVAAHGNRRPPKNFLITQDNIYEIQRFASYLIYLAIESRLRQTTHPHDAP